MTVIKFTTLDIPVDLVEQSIVVLQQVQFLNRNRNDAHTPLLVVTDCDREVRKHVVVNHKTADRDFTRFLGLTFHRNHGKAVWLSPRGCSHDGKTWAYDLTRVDHRKDVVGTIVHEFAHVVAGRRRGHGWGFRRAYTLLLDFVGNDVFSNWVAGGLGGLPAFDVWSTVEKTIARYQRLGEYERPATGSYSDGSTWSWSGLRRREELDKHVAALARMRKRIAKISTIK